MKKYYYGAAIGAAIVFLLFGFYEQSIIPADWDKETRGICVFLMLCGSFYGCLISAATNSK